MRDDDFRALIRSYGQVYGTVEGRAVLDDICERLLGENKKLLSSDQSVLIARAANHDAAKEIRALIKGLKDDPVDRPEVRKHG